LDMSTVQAEDGGRIQIDNNMIVWDYAEVPQLKSLDVQEQSEINFSVKVKNEWLPSGTETDNTVINNEVNISQIAQKFSIKVSSGLAISQKGYYQSYDLTNSGPIPPKVNQATTYVINWEIKNHFSDAKNVKVKAVLPNNVSLTGQIMPQDEASNFSFDSVSREIVWSVGDVLAGTGVNGDPITLSFQVSLTPNSSQKGLVATIIDQVQVSGENQFTNTAITSQDSGVDTMLPDDLTNSGGGVVQ
ncbi:MAG: hypothetical protein WCK10_03980, partial [Candidatus Staskawiczbacteria bacterium]